MLPSEAKEWKHQLGNGELPIGWVPPQAASPEPLSYPETKKRSGSQTAHHPGTGDTRSLLRATLIPPFEMNAVVKYNKGRAQNNLNSEIKKEVIFVPSQERRPKSPSSNLDKTAEENGERQILLNKTVLGGQG